MAKQGVSLPYHTSPGVIDTALEKIRAASTPDRVTQDFVITTLSIKGGAGKAVVPFLKKVGFIRSDGTPTEIYTAFRNHSKAGTAAAQALRLGYKALYDINERAHDLQDADLKGLIVQVTGLEEKSTAVQQILGSFKRLKK